MGAVTYVDLPFRVAFMDRLLNGTKTATSRFHRHGIRGDCFRVFGGVFVITNVEHVRLGFVADAYFRKEGCDTREQFVDVWKRIHPRRGFDPHAWVYVHHFVRVPP